MGFYMEYEYHAMTFKKLSSNPRKFNCRVLHNDIIW